MQVWTAWALLKGLHGNDVTTHADSNSHFVQEAFKRVTRCPGGPALPCSVGHAYDLLDTIESDMQCHVRAAFGRKDWSTSSREWYYPTQLDLICTNRKDGSDRTELMQADPAIIIGIPKPAGRHLDYEEVGRLLQIWLEYVVRRETDLPFDSVFSPKYLNRIWRVMDLPPLLHKGAEVLSLKGVGHPDFQRHVVVEYKQLSASGGTVGDVVHLLVEREQIDTATKNSICNGSYGSCFFGHGDEYHFCSGKNEELVSAVRERNQRDAAMDWRKRLPLLSGEQQWSDSIGSQGMFGRIGRSHAAQEAARKREWIKAGGRR